MGQKYLGEVFDIHTGGIDLIPTHHENEIAQSKGACGKIPARFWMHGEYLLINGGKMSKSLGNVYLVKDIEARGYEPLVYRLFTYSSSYRNKINFTWEGMEANAKALIKLRDGYQKHLKGNEDVEDSVVNDFEERFHKAINDDLNMPLAMSVVWDVIKYQVKSQKLADLLKKFDTVLALKIDKPLMGSAMAGDNADTQVNIPEEIRELAEKRLIARADKNWAESDRLRDEIASKGYTIKDNKDGYEISKMD
jgi:cysteinyl-tRNA synthetase